MPNDAHLKQSLFLLINGDTLILTDTIFGSEKVSTGVGSIRIELTRPGMPILCDLKLALPRNDDSHDTATRKFLAHEDTMHEITLTFKYPAHAIHILS